MPSILRIPTFSGGMNTSTSPSQIARSESVLLRNLTTKGSRIATLPGYMSIYGGDISGKGQGGKSSGKKHTFIHNNSLYYYNEETGISTKFENAVGVGLDGTTSTNEDYNLTLYKDWIIVTNSLKSGVSTLANIGETVRVYRYDKTTNTLIPEIVEGLPDKYAPTVAIVYNGRLYLAGGPEDSLYKNMIRWGGRELPDEAVGDITVSISYLFNFIKSLTSPAGVVPNYSPGWEVVGDGDPITALFTNRNDFFIGKRNSIHTGLLGLNKTGNIYEGTYMTTSKKTNTGIKNQEVVQDINQNTMYFDGVHIRRLEAELSTSNLFDSFLSRRMQTFMECLPEDQRYATSCYSYPYYKLFLRKDFNSQENDVAIVYNVEDDSFSIQDGISVYHAWTSYDELNARWNGFWQGMYDNSLIKDNIGSTWNGFKRDFEYIGPGIDFGDAVRSKDLLDIHYQITLDTELTLEHYTNVYRASPSTGCITNQKCNYRCIKGCETPDKLIEKGTGNYGGYVYGEYSTPGCTNMITKTLKFPCRLNGQYFQEVFKGEGLGMFSMEYTDFLYSLKNK